MKKNVYQELTNEKLLKKRDLLKGISIGFGIIFLLSIAIFIYLFLTKGSILFATLVPFFAMPVTFVPLMMNLDLMNKEIKSRNL